jgi:hypothetical protein
LKGEHEVYARVARWEGAEAQAVRDTANRIRSEADPGPPEGVPAKGFLLLIDPDNGRSMGITLFETMEDLRQGDEVLNSMSPPEQGMGQRVAVDIYEVGFEARL